MTKLIVAFRNSAKAPKIQPELQLVVFKKKLSNTGTKLKDNSAYNATADLRIFFLNWPKYNVSLHLNI
jgi:hypothetical protein